MNTRQLGMFLTVGLTSAGVNFLTFFVFLNLIGLNYLVASTIAYVLSVMVHFLGNRNFTFKSGHLEMLPQLKRYLCMLGVNYLISMLTISTCVSGLHLSPYLGLAAAIAVTVGLGYLVSQQWVFKTS